MNTTPDLTPRIVEKERSRWENRHQNFTQSIRRLYDVWNPEVTDGREMDGLKATVSGLQSLVEDASDTSVVLRPLGSGWSFSRVAAADGWLLNTKPLNWIFGMSAASVSADYAGERDALIFAQCGASIYQINEFTRKRGRSLKTSGASNGQTIAGAISTGTHGSAFQVGAMQDYVVGLHLIVGPSRHVWLERASYPVVSAGFIDRLGADWVRDDELFNAALVSLGGFGIIHAVMIETDPLYLLEAHRQRLSLTDELKHTMETLAFSAQSLPHPEEEPHHFQVVVNPYDRSGGAYVETMYRRPYREDYTRSEKGPGGLGPGDDLLHVIGTLSDEIPDLVSGVMRGFFDSLYGEFESRVGTSGEQFGSTEIRGSAIGAGIGFPVARANDVLDAVLSVNERDGPFAGVFALRYVKASDALLAFTRFEPTCVLDLDGVESERSRAFFRAVWSRFEELEIPYTVHWGKVHELDADSVRAMYGDAAVEEWISARDQLLGEGMREVFSSPLLERTGLHR